MPQNFFDRMRRTIRHLFPWSSPSDSDTELPVATNAELRIRLREALHVTEDQLAGLTHDELVLLEQHHTAHTQQCESLATSWWRDDDLTVEALLTGPVDVVLHHRPRPEHVTALRRHPDRLRTIVDSGMATLCSLESVANWSACTPPGPPVAVWLEAMCAGVRNPAVDDSADSASKDDITSASMLTILKRFDVSAVCGYYFDDTETGVHCLECTADTTCVMCMACFRTSPCRFHKYRLTSTTSGGMCDCGNPHMWKPESFCTHHGAHVTPENPIDSFPAEHRGWIAETIKGLLHFLSIILQVGLTFRKVPWTTPELVLGGPQVGADEWMLNWLTLAAEQLKVASECGDGSRRFLTNAWTSTAHTLDYPFESLERVGFSSPTASLTCLETLFMFDICIGDDDGDVSELRRTPSYKDVMKCVANCLPDSAFRLPYAVHMCQYSEMMSNSDDLGNLCVQVLNSVAVRSLMERPLPIVSSTRLTDTIVHRMMSPVLYLLTTLNDSQRPGFGTIPAGEWMVPLIRTEQLSTFSLTFFSMCVGCSHEAAVATVLSRSCFKAFCSLALVIQCNSDVFKDPAFSSPTNVVSIPHWLGCAIVSEIWRLQLNIREMMAVLTDSRGDRVASARLLDLRPSVVAALKQSVILDDPQLSERYTRMLAHCRVDDGAAPLTWGEDGSPSSQDPAFALGAELLREILHDLNIFIQVQDILFRNSCETVVLHPKAPHARPVRAYELLKAGHAVSTTNTSLTLVSFVLRAWMMEVGRRNGYWWGQEDHYTPEVAHSVRLHGGAAVPAAATVLLPDSPEWLQPSQTRVTDLLDAALGRADDVSTMLDGLLDGLVMPLVLISQVEQGLWRRNDHNVSVTTQTYLLSGTKCFLEGDLFLLQVLSARIAPEDFTMRVLQRFTYPKSSGTDSRGNEDDDPGHTISGYSRYLRLILTIVQDTSKSCNYTEFSQSAVDRTVANLLSGSRMQHSRVLQFVNNRIPGEFEGEKVHDAPQGCKVEKMVRESLEKLAVGEHTNVGLQFRLKSTAVWRQYVDLYYPMVSDESMQSMYEQYRSIETLENLQSGTAGGEQDYLNDEESGVAAPSTATAVVQLPPPVLRSPRQFAELLPPTRALLHTEAFLLPCFFVLHLFNENVKRRARGESDTYYVSEPLLLHAVSGLHCCIQDCEELSAALESVSEPGASALESTHTAGAVPLTPRSSKGTPINWPRVEAYVRDKVQRQRSYEPADCHLYLPVPMLAGETGLRHKLQLPVSSLRMPKSGLVISQAADDVSPSLTTTQVLHEVRARYNSGAEIDRFGVAKMIDHILLATGLAEFSANEQDEDTEAERKRREEANRRQKRLKERQSKLLQRMRMRCAKATPTATTTIATNTANAGDDATMMLRPLRQHESGYLHTKLLMDLATLECCVCRVTSDEPLMMVAHTATSGSLYHLRRDSPGVLPTGRTSHGHFHACGHAAHMTCIEKVYSRLAKQWSGGAFFEGRYYLGPSEFSCPMCMMICNTVCVCPALSNPGTLSNATSSPIMMAAGAAPATGLTAMTIPPQSSSGGGGGPSQPSSPPLAPSSADVPGASSETLFEELRRCSVNPHSPFYRQLTTRCDALFGTVAAANIGLNPSEDAAPLVSQEDPLQKSSPDAWELAETIRCAVVELRLAVELSWIAQPPTRKDMISILALLTSIYASRVEASYSQILRRFQESGEGMCVLLLDCLRTPRRTAELIELYTVALMQSSDEVRAVTDAWLSTTATDEASTTTSDEDAAVLMSLLRELLSLSYLKLLLVEEPAHLVLKAEEDKSSDVVAHVELESSVAREDTLLRHLAYLLRCKVEPELVSKPSSTLGAATRADVRQVLSLRRALSPPVTSALVTIPALATLAPHYESPRQWARHLLSTVLHQDEHYTQLLTDFAKTGVCSQCGKVSRRPVMCCLCHRYFCLQPNDSAPELNAHTRSCCCGGLGLYLVVRGTTYVFVDSVASRIGEYPSIYTDDFGETDNNLARGVPLTRNDDDGQRLLTTWIACRWGVASRIVKHSYGGSIIMSV